MSYWIHYDICWGLKVREIVWELTAKYIFPCISTEGFIGQAPTVLKACQLRICSGGQTKFSIKDSDDLQFLVLLFLEYNGQIPACCVYQPNSGVHRGFAQSHWEGYNPPWLATLFYWLSLLPLYFLVLGQPFLEGLYLALCFCHFQAKMGHLHNPEEDSVYDPWKSVHEYTWTLGVVQQALINMLVPHGQAASRLNTK